MNESKNSAYLKYEMHTSKINNEFGKEFTTYGVTLFEKSPINGITQMQTIDDISLNPNDINSLIQHLNANQIHSPKFHNTVENFIDSKYNSYNYFSM